MISEFIRREGGRIQSRLKEFALCIRVSSFFPARVTGLRAGKNVTIPVQRSARSAHSAHSARSARQQIDVKPSWKMQTKSSFFTPIFMKIRFNFTEFQQISETNAQNF